VVGMMSAAQERIRIILKGTLSIVPPDRGCTCTESIKEAKI
jgi:hypothetical protein